MLSSFTFGEQETANDGGSDFGPFEVRFNLIDHLCCHKLGLYTGGRLEVITVVTLNPILPPFFLFFFVKNLLAVACFLDYLKKINIKNNLI